MKKLFAVFTVALSFVALADEKKINTPQTQSARLDTVTITATTSERQTLTVPASISLINREDIEDSNATWVPELLKNLSGIRVSQAFGTPSSYRVDMRGFGEVAAANTLVVVDGRPINRSDLAEINWTTIPLDRIERIEVIRGGRSVLYGDNAVAGVVSIFTRGNAQEDKDPTLTLKSRFGSFDTQQYSASLSGAKDGVAYFVDANYFNSKGYRENNFFRNRSTSFGLLFDDGGDWTFDLKGGWSQSKTGFPSTRPAGGKRTDAGTPEDFGDTREHYLTFAPSYSINKDVTLNFTVDMREYESSASFFSSFGDSFSRFRTNDVKVSPNIKIDHECDNFSNTFIAGFDHSYSRKKQLRSTSAYSAQEGEKTTRRSTGAYIFNSMSFLDDTLHVDAGYRRDRIRYGFSPIANEGDHYDLNAASFGIAWNYTEGSKLFASYDRSFRSVRVDELGGPAFNELISPQRGETFQIGIDHALTKKLRVGATAFQIDIKNEIFFDPSLGFFGQNETYEETQRRGIELDIAYQASDDLHLYANYTYMDAELKGDTFKGNDIPDVAPQTINAGFDWQFVDNMSLNLNANWSDEHQPLGDFGNTLDAQDKKILVDAKVTWDLNEYFTVYAGVNNLLDDNYNETEPSYGSYPAPGLNYFGGINFTCSL